MIANYSKRLGLPGYSSHQFSVCVETEISSIDDVARESSRLYETLQQSVDEEIQRTGFVPEEGYGKSNRPARNGSSNGHANGHAAPTNGNGHSNPHTNGQSANGETWACREKQQDLILKLVDEHRLDKGEVDATAYEMFGVGVKDLSKLQASGLIDLLIEQNEGERQVVLPRRSPAPRRAYQNGRAR